MDNIFISFHKAVLYTIFVNVIRPAYDNKNKILNTAINY